MAEKEDAKVEVKQPPVIWPAHIEQVKPKPWPINLTEDHVLDVKWASGARMSILLSDLAAWHRKGKITLSQHDETTWLIEMDKRLAVGTIPHPPKKGK